MVTRNFNWSTEILWHETGYVKGKILSPIVIKLGPGIDPIKEPGPGFYRSTRVSPDQSRKILNFF
jgi:hypothetical protein